jgi:hypothetical protein
MKIDGLENLLAMQERIAKATVGNNGLTRLSEISQAIAGQHNKLKSMMPSWAIQNQFKNSFANNELIKQMQAIAVNASKIQETWRGIFDMNPMVQMAKQFKNSNVFATSIKGQVLPNDFVKTMQAIAGNANKMYSSWKLIIDNNPLMQLAKSFKGIEALTASFKDYALPGIHPLVIEELSNQTREAVLIAEDISTQDFVTKDDLRQFEEFVASSFAKLAEKIRKSSKSPMVVIGFWVGIIGLLLGIVFQLLQAKPATQSQVKELQEESREMRQDIKKLNSFVEKHFLNTVRDLSESRILTWATALRLKPKTKSLFIFTAEKDDVVNVIAINHKWAYVTLMDNNNMPASGWILKKYLK